ncbi:MAG: Asp-tRNA(Asn)/Glu-tRNA(Gln) amidotransferase GatCAB subunit A [Candidatus Puniceispirillum sp.]|nr:Asp-tRNA(Asn)/Glu-tRNA(Gln) amidotransferase GatCAB subunit A [Candidatus Pelagibacter sp.]MBA4283172.1 Asp-tRNA(Asn)/Glu-tRNA(Gln) amidotransferase GatCAB subunit A [Candidatus Puniceispirillum sp.]
MNDLLKLSAVALRQQLQNKQCTSEEVTKAYIARIEQSRVLNAYVFDNFDKAIEQAKASDQRYAKGEALALDGLPLGIKDLFCTKDLRTTAASKILSNYVPPFESTVTQNLWNKGALCLGKLNMDEFAMGSTNQNSYWGPVISPWKKKSNPTQSLVPGGSSGGSSAAVSAHLCVAALGSDTGGSIRQPAAFCGLVGIKPTYGRCSRYGMVAFASSLDQAGPITRSVADAALILESISGYDLKDATTENKAVEQFSKNLNTNIKGLKVGVPYHLLEGLKPEIKANFEQSITWLKEAGAEVVDVTINLASYALATYYIIAPAEASSNLSRYDGLRYGVRIEGETLDDMYTRTRSDGFGEEVQRRILIGTYVLSSGFYDAYYSKAQKVRQAIKYEFKKAFESVDVICTPTTPSAAFGLDESPKDPVQMYLNDIFTVTANIAGLPAISVPSGLTSEELPLGFQIIGRHFDEQTILNAGLVIEQSAKFNLPFKEIF